MLLIVPEALALLFNYIQYKSNQPITHHLSVAKRQTKQHHNVMEWQHEQSYSIFGETNSSYSIFYLRKITVKVHISQSEAKLHNDVRTKEAAVGTDHSGCAGLAALYVRVLYCTKKY